MPRRSAAAFLLFAVVLPGCGGGDPARDPSASAMPASTPTPSAGAPMPTGTPTGGVFFRAGEATLTIDGREASMELGRSVPSTFASGVLSLSFGNPATGPFLNIAGQAHPGENPTGPAFSMSVGNGTVVVAPTADECAVTFEQLSPEGVRGSFACAGLSAPGGRVDASGAFSAGP